VGYIQNFKKFLKTEEEQKTAGANPVVSEQGSTEPADATQETPKTEAPAAAAPSVESDPKVVAARANLLQVQTNRDKQIAAKKAELDKLTADQNALVNTTTGALNQALKDATAAAKTATT